jgi:hypothetical protein
VRTPASDCRTIASSSLISVAAREAYPAVCGKRATLLGEVDRQGNTGGTRSSRWMLRGQVFGRGRCNAIPAKHWIAGRRSAVRGRCPSALVLGFAALNPFYGGSMTHEVEGDSVAYSASRGRVSWVERSKTHRMNQRRGGAGVSAMGLRHEHRRQSANREIPAFDH